MTDLERLGLALVDFAVAVVAAGVRLGFIGAWITAGGDEGMLEAALTKVGGTR